MDTTPGTAAATCRGAHARPLGVYKPRRPQASPLFLLVQDHLHPLQTVYDERFARTHGPWRPVMRQVAEKFLACGILDHGFARVRCDACAHEYILAFSCKARYFCLCRAEHKQNYAQCPIMRSAERSALCGPMPGLRIIPGGF